MEKCQRHSDRQRPLHPLRRVREGVSSGLYICHKGGAG